jgi:limonene-1,2-epoxide hydrolase
MPWFPDFVSAVELARRQTRATALADPAAEFLNALSEGEARDLEAAWPGKVAVYDPRAGEIRTHHRLRQFISRNHAWFAAHNARIETVATTSANGRAVLELMAHVTGDDGQQIAWPVAVVAESPDDLSVVFRTYCSQWPVDGHRPLRPAILPPGEEHPGDVVARYLAASDAGDIDASVNAFAPDGYYREPIGPHRTHHGTAELRAFFTARFGSGGIGVQDCAVTDDGVRCALEYNCIRWAGRTLTPQAGLAIYERRPDGLLGAARLYDDIEAPM